MKQLVQKLGSGKMSVIDVPEPKLKKGYVLVQNYYSAISAGTEGATVSLAKKSLIEKALSKPDQVHQVLNTLKTQGPANTIRAVQKKLDSYSPLGYSSCGVVLEIGEGVTDINIGDKVACAGVGYANHAEIISVPKNLCVKLGHQSDFKGAAYNTLGAIAMQSVRQAKVQVGEYVVVIGLGLLGHILCQILKASGANTIGIDIDNKTIDQALKFNSIDYGFNIDDPQLTDKINQITNTNGADNVIIAAATKSDKPINLAGSIARKKANVVILGDVPTGFNREPDWYKKELSLIMSCSYGPGRYDPDYEEKGIDYPIGYVRWTEKRNMEAFQTLIRKNLINLDYITTHTFDLKNCTKAYDLITNKNEEYLGILIKYSNKKIQLNRSLKNLKKSNISKLNISFIGSGNYAQGSLLPFIKNKKNVSLNGVISSSGTTSISVMENFGFNFCTSNEKELYDGKTNTVFITTPHNSHYDYVCNALKQNVNVYVEKPLCLSIDELETIKSKYEKANIDLMVGFNRRFSPLIKQMKAEFKNVSCLNASYRINSGLINNESWLNDKDIGGGRILGEVCHFIDLIIYLTGSDPTYVTANFIDNKLKDSINILIAFSNGSSATISYFTNGSPKMAKESLELHANGKSVLVEDFKNIKTFQKSRTTKKSFLNQNKGQKEMINAYLESLLNQSEPLIPFKDIYLSTKTTILAQKSAFDNGKRYEIEY